jgi:phosphoglycerol transferase MdoB-like AlkP superfamily enzyme
MKPGKNFRKNEILIAILCMLVSDLSVMCNFTQCSTHAIQCFAILRNVFYFSLCCEIIHVALFSLSIAIQKTKHLNDCLVNLALYISQTTFQYKCWELSVYNLNIFNHVYVKRTTALMI